MAATCSIALDALEQHGDDLIDHDMISSLVTWRYKRDFETPCATTVKQLQHPLVSLAKTFLFVDITSQADVKITFGGVALFVYALANIVKHGAYIFMDKEAGVMSGNFYWAWTKQQYMWQYTGIVAAIMPTCCACISIYFKLRRPEVLRRYLKPLADIFGSLDTLIRRELQKLLRMLKAVLKAIAVLRNLTVIGYFLSGVKLLGLNAWMPYAALHAILFGIQGYFNLSGAAALCGLYLVLCRSLTLRFKTIRNKALGIAATVGRHERHRWTAVWGVLTDFDAACVDLYKYDRIWKLKAFVVVCGNVPLVCFILYLGVISSSAAAQARLVAAWCAMSFSLFVSLFILSASQMHTEVINLAN